MTIKLVPLIALIPEHDMDVLHDVTDNFTAICPPDLVEQLTQRGWTPEMYVAGRLLSSALEPTGSEPTDHESTPDYAGLDLLCKRVTGRTIAELQASEFNVGFEAGRAAAGADQ